MKIRLQKYLANITEYSRRQIEELVQENKIQINNTLAQLGDKVDDQDEIKIYNKIINKPNKDEKKVYLKLNKPIDYVCTRKTFKTEKNIFSLLPEKYFNLKPVGRLDKDSEGLIILTNDGDYIYKQTHPKFEVEKEYVVGVNNEINQKLLNTLKEGVDISLDNIPEIVKAKKIKKISSTKFAIIIAQGKNRQIRRMCQSVGLRVVSLQRVREGEVSLGDLEVGDYSMI
jgi:pseudouridine synthase